MGKMRAVTNLCQADFGAGVSRFGMKFPGVNMKSGVDVINESGRGSDPHLWSAAGQQTHGDKLDIQSLSE
jgi:hypothetical protein